MSVKNVDELAKLLTERMENLGLNYYQLEKRNPELSYHAVKRATEGKNIVSTKLLALLIELDFDIVLNENDKTK